MFKVQILFGKIILITPGVRKLKTKSDCSLKKKKKIPSFKLDIYFCAD